MLKLTHIIVLALFSANSLAADWSVSIENSSVSFVSIKKNNMAETHRFTDFSGAISGGKAIINIKPDSVDSRVPIRDERMREFLFNTGLYPTINVNADVLSILEQQQAGDSNVVTIMAELDMHGTRKELPLNLRVSRLTEAKMVVSTIEPVLVRAANFDMVEGIQKLSSLVNGLPIVETVPVSFSLMFSKMVTSKTTK